MPELSKAANSDASHMVVIGGGWAGWGAAKALCEAGVRVTLVDGMPDPTGRTPMRTASGKPFEAGTRGFWRDYPNINALTDELGLTDVFTAFTTSAFWSPAGLEATAPVFGDGLQLPSPLGQAMATIKNFKRLPVADRMSIAGLLVAATGRDIQPHVGLQVVAFHAGTSGVQVAEGELGFAVSQARGGFIPPDGFCGVARRTDALVKAMAQLILGFSVIVFSFGQQGSQAQNAESVGLQEHHAKTTSQAGYPGPKTGVNRFHRGSVILPLWSESEQHKSCLNV